jgi:hypothetical protein
MLRFATLLLLPVLGGCAFCRPAPPVAPVPHPSVSLTDATKRVHIARVETVPDVRVGAGLVAGGDGHVLTARTATVVRRTTCPAPVAGFHYDCE